MSQTPNNELQLQDDPSFNQINDQSQPDLVNELLKQGDEDPFASYDVSKKRKLEYATRSRPRLNKRNPSSQWRSLLTSKTEQSSAPDELEALEPKEEEKPKSQMKIPMRGPSGYGIGMFDPSAVKLKSSRKSLPPADAAAIAAASQTFQEDEEDRQRQERIAKSLEAKALREKEEQERKDAARREAYKKKQELDKLKKLNEQGAKAALEDKKKKEAEEKQKVELETKLKEARSREEERIREEEKRSQDEERRRKEEEETNQQRLREAEETKKREEAVAKERSLHEQELRRRKEEQSNQADTVIPIRQDTPLPARYEQRSFSDSSCDSSFEDEEDPHSVRDRHPLHPLTSADRSWFAGYCPNWCSII